MPHQDDQGRRTATASWRTKRGAAGLVAVAAATAMTLAACSPGSTNKANNSPSSGPVSTGINTSKKVTITVSDGWGNEGGGAVFAKVIKNFATKYPNVTVNRETTDYSSYLQTVNLKLNSPNPPDVMMLETSGYGQGFYSAISANKLLPLDSYAKAYDWASRVGSDASLNVFRMNPSQHYLWGSGNLYGVPEQNSIIGVFYNKSLLKKAGFDSPPATYADFVKTLQGAKAHRVTPIEESSTFIHTEMALWDSFATSADQVNNWIYGASGTFGSPENMKASQTIQDWNKDGYFEKGAVGTTDNDAAAAFLGGKAMYYVEGSWMSGGVEGSLKVDGGWFPFPSTSPNSPVGGGPTTPLVIPANAKNKDVAAEFLNFFLSQEQTDFMFQQGWGLPGGQITASLAKAGTPTANIVASLAKAEGSGGGGTTPFIDWANPQYSTQLSGELQSLAAGRQSAAAFTNKIQGQWTQFHNKRKS
jgi:raffinose/stachyose/melibiose transport system substrate-binding protein